MAWTDENTARFLERLKAERLGLSMGSDSSELPSGTEPSPPIDVDAEVARLSARAIKDGVTGTGERPSRRVIPKRKW